MGYLNDHLSELSFLKEAGLIQVVKPGTPTHRDVGTLDQVWTNISVTHSEMIQIDEITFDPKAIQVDHQFKSKEPSRRFET